MKRTSAKLLTTLWAALGLLLGMAGGAEAQAVYNPPASASASSGLLPGWVNVKNAPYNATGNGTTDDTIAVQSAINAAVAAGGGTIFFPAGIYLIGGSLQDTSASNCQLRIPSTPLSAQQISVTFAGFNRPPVQFDPGTGAVLPTAGYSIIKSTLTGASGSAALIAGRGPLNGSATSGENNIEINFRNLIFQCPANPTFSCLNLSDMQGDLVKDVLIECGSVNLTTVTQPTSSNAYGLIAPPTSHSPFNDLEGVNVFGFYTGYKAGENDSVNGMVIWGCWVGVEIPGAYHPNLFTRLGIAWCPYGIKLTGTATPPQAYFRITVLDVEHANNGGAAWQNNVSDLVDPNNYGHGDIGWLAVSSAVGVDHTYLMSGGSGITAAEIGIWANVPAAPGWWNNGGAIAGAVAAYAPKGAATYAASKINLVASGHVLADVTAPSWTTGAGWTFNGSSQYLMTDISPPGNQASTLIVKFSGASGAGAWVVGSSLPYGIQPVDDSSTGGAKVAYLNGGLVRVSPSLTAGALALRGSQGNRNGVDEGTVIGSAGTASSPLYIGAYDTPNGMATAYWGGTITSLAYYNVTLTQAQVATIAAAMP